MGCNACLHPTCQYGLAAFAVCPCPGSGRDTHGRGGGRGQSHEEKEGETRCSGLMVLDKLSQPNWKLCCNRCNTLIRFHGELKKVSVLQVRAQFASGLSHANCSIR